MEQGLTAELSSAIRVAQSSSYFLVAARVSGVQEVVYEKVPCPLLSYGLPGEGDGVPTVMVFPLLAEHFDEVAL